MGGPDGKIFGSRSGCTDRVQRGLYVLTESQMFTFMTHCGENKLWQQQISFLPLTRIDFAALVSSRAVRVFPALSLRRVRPSYGTFSLMVLQGNCARGRTGHEINHNIYRGSHISLSWFSCGSSILVESRRKTLGSEQGGNQQQTQNKSKTTARNLLIAINTKL